MTNSTNYDTLKVIDSHPSTEFTEMVNSPGTSIIITILFISVLYCLIERCANTTNLLFYVMKKIQKCACPKCIAYMQQVKQNAVNQGKMSDECILKIEGKYKTVIVFSDDYYVYSNRTDKKTIDWKGEYMKTANTRGFNPTCDIVTENKALLSDKNWDDTAFHMFCNKYVVGKKTLAEMNIIIPPEKNKDN